MGDRIVQRAKFKKNTTMKALTATAGKRRIILKSKLKQGSIDYKQKIALPPFKALEEDQGKVVNDTDAATLREVGEEQNLEVYKQRMDKEDADDVDDGGVFTAES